MLIAQLGDRPQEVSGRGLIPSEAGGIADGIADQAVRLHHVDGFVLGTAFMNMLRHETVVFDGQPDRTQNMNSIRK